MRRNAASAGVATRRPPRTRRSPDQSNTLGPFSRESHVYQNTRAIPSSRRDWLRSRSAVRSRTAWARSATSNPTLDGTRPRDAGHDSYVTQIGSAPSP